MSCCMPSPATDGSSNLFEASGVSLGNLEGAERSALHAPGGAASCWMEHLANLEPTLRYRDLLVVGTHNAASSTIQPSRPFSAIARCQNLSVLEQLEAGIRLLDLRVGGFKGSKRPSDIGVWHGSMQAGPFLPILRQIEMFANAHTKEVLILNLVPEYGVAFASEQKLFLLKQIHETFNSRLITSAEMTHLLSRWTLHDLEQKGKQVIVLFHPRFCQDLKVSASKGNAKHSREWTESELEAEFDVINADVWMRNLWFNTRNCNDLFSMVLDDIRRHGNKKQHHLHCSQFVLTPGVGGAMDVMKALAGTNPLRPLSLSQQLYKQQTLNKFLRSHSTDTWNMFLLDFVDYCPWTVRFLTALNFPVPVRISLALYKSGKDVVVMTKKIAEYTYRGRVVFLTNLVEDLGLSAQSMDGDFVSSGGELVVAYSLGDKSYYVLTIPVVTESSMLMISHFATSADSVIAVPTSNQEGIINGGKLLDDRTSATKLKGTALRFKSVDSNCLFDQIRE